MKIRLANKIRDDYEQLEIEDSLESIVEYFNFRMLSCHFDTKWTVYNLKIKKAGYDARESWNDELYYVYLGEMNVGYINKIPKEYGLKNE